MSKKEEKVKWFKSSWFIGSIVFLSIVLAWVFYPFWIKYYLRHEVLNDYNEFGDSFGAFNALVSSFALIGVIVSIYIQGKELKLQREELSDTREELRLQKKEMEKQNETLSKQQFENTFYKQIEVYNSIISSYSTDSSSGRAVFGAAYNYFDSELGEFQYKENRSPNNPTIENGKKAFCSTYDLFITQLSSYFNLIESMFNYLETSKTKEEYYANYFINQFTYWELQLIFYYATMSEKGSELKRMASLFPLLKNLPKTEILVQDAINNISPNAFDNQKEENSNLEVDPNGYDN